MSNEQQSPKITLIIAIITVLGGLGGSLFANWDKIFPSTNTPKPKPTETSPTVKSPQLKPEVNFKIEKADSSISIAKMRIGNITQQGVIVVERPVLHWNFSDCPNFKGAEIDAAIQGEFSYNVKLTQEGGLKLLDERKFRYGSGDSDDFSIFITYPHGIYQVWLEFEYEVLGENIKKNYATPKSNISRCTEKR